MASRAVAGRQLAAATRRTRAVRRTVAARAEAINPSIQKDEAKVVNIVPVPEPGTKAVYCRCWRSGKFPLCDAAHVEHNKATGDNVGPLIVDNPK